MDIDLPRDGSSGEGGKRPLGTADGEVAHSGRGLLRHPERYHLAFRIGGSIEEEQVCSLDPPKHGLAGCGASWNVDGSFAVRLDRQPHRHVGLQPNIDLGAFQVQWDLPRYRE